MLSSGIFGSILLACILASVASGANILLVPYAHGFNSRLMNMAKISHLLDGAGHKTNILINSVVQSKISNQKANWYVYNMPDSANVRQSTDREWIELLMRGGPKDDTSIYGMPKAWADFQMPFCEALLSDKEMLPNLKAQNFDLLFIDVGDDCSRIIADYLDIPTMLYSNYGFNHDYRLFYPQPFTFVCAPELPDVCTSDDMTFDQRIGNLVAHFIMEFVTTPYIYERFDELRQKYKYNETLKAINSFNNHVVVANADFAIDFPRPLMPHIITVSGIFRQDPKPLPSDLEEFFQSSGDHGVVILSFGTLISTLDDVQAERVARVFARLPQKVLWRHSGKVPRGLGKNTLLKDWIPQNDVLAHPKTVLFVTHCGISSTFETAIHGVPVVTVPLFADQRYNAARLVNRAKMGIHMDIKTLTEESFEKAVRGVLDDPTYKENAAATSKMMHDSPISPKEEFLYWVDYVIRHKGARHLQSIPARRMNWVQYVGLDAVLAVVTTLFIMMLALLGLIYITYKLVCNLRLSKKYKSS